jgi:hypothetical protein
VSDNLLEINLDPGLASPFPGWYTDPLNGDHLRFWDGRLWTQQTLVDQVVRDRVIGDNVTGKRETGVRIDLVSTATESAPPDGVSLVNEGEIVVDSANVVTVPSRGAPRIIGDPEVVAGDVPLFDPTHRVADSVPNSSGPAGPKKTNASSPRRLPVVLLVVALAAAFGLIGYSLGVDRSDGLVATMVQATEVTTTAEDDAASASDEVAEQLITQTEGLVIASDKVASLEARLEGRESELEIVSTELDNVVEHARLLRTWFDDGFIARSQQEWDAEVMRVCDLVADGAALDEDLIQFTSSLEVTGSPGMLFAAVGDCE